MDFDSMSLGQLFDAADEIGDRYLTAEDIADRDRAIAEAMSLPKVQKFRAKVQETLDKFDALIL